MVDVVQAWEDGTTPAKHSQRALDYVSQQGCNKDRRAQRWSHTPWRPQTLPDQPGWEICSTAVGDQNNRLPTLPAAAVIHSALGDPLPAVGVSGEVRAQMVEGDIHNRWRRAGTHR